MTFDLFLLGLMIASTLTALVTEALKKLFDGYDCSANVMASLSAIGVSVIIGAVYIILTEATLNAQMAVYLIALVLLSWLSAMVGYDKVVQAISQIKKGE